MTLMFVLGTNEVTVSSFDVLSEANSIAWNVTRNANVQTEMERMENPFRNLHPKIYHRQKNAPLKSGIVDQRKELETEFKSSFTLSFSRQKSKPLPSVKANDYSVIDQMPTSRKENDSRKEGSLRRKPSGDYDTLEYLNQRNISVSTDASEGEKLILPWLTIPRTERDTRSMNARSRIKPFGENNKGIFPTIKDVPSFISLESGDDRNPERKRWRTKTKHIQGAKLGGDNESWWNMYSLYTGRRREDLAKQVIYEKGNQGNGTLLESDTRRTLRGSQRVITETDLKHHVTPQILSARTRGHHDNAKEEIRRDYMILKAKIHRSSFL